MTDYCGGMDNDEVSARIASLEKERDELRKHLKWAIKNIRGEFYLHPGTEKTGQWSCAYCNGFVDHAADCPYDAARKAAGETT